MLAMSIPKRSRSLSSHAVEVCGDRLLHLGLRHLALRLERLHELPELPRDLVENLQPRLVSSETLKKGRVRRIGTMKDSCRIRLLIQR